MAISHPERQYPLVDVVTALVGDLATGVVVNAIKLPPNAVVLNGGAFIETADTVSTTSVLDVGDAAAADLYVTVLDAKTAGESEAFDVTELGKLYPNGDWITVRRTISGSASPTGKYRVWVQYVILDKVHEVQP